VGSDGVKDWFREKDCLGEDSGRASYFPKIGVGYTVPGNRS
jgi:hypothetical protein